MVYLLLAIASSLGIGAVFKESGLRGVDRLHLITINYLVAAALGAFLVYRAGAPWMDAGTGFLVFGTAVGAFLAVGFLVIAVSTQRAGISLTLAVQRTGVSIPFIVSWLAWAEVPSTLQWLGFSLVVASLIFLTRPVGQATPAGAASSSPATPRSGSAVLLLLAVFVTGGLGDLSFKTFDVWYGARLDGHVFLTLAFGVAFLVGLVPLFRRPVGQRIAKRDAVLWGVLLGVLNYGSILFLLGAVARIPGIVVFPTLAASVVVGGTVLGTVIWRERVSAVNLLGVALAAAGVVLLNA
ncbi:MAG: hypothetical protein HKN29_06045 [Rhodothermales bacterium]|nr:hypothetical protein [Rhodothermales bacterium]